jgi:N-methylhydantoinase B
VLDLTNRPSATVYEYERQKVDPVTFQVIHHRLTSITDEQAAILSAISGSPLVNEATDYNTGIFRAHGEIVTMGKTVLFHAASVAEMVKHIIADCEMSPGFRPGDMYLVNHPYKGALHAPDFGLAAPVFHNGMRICWIGVCCHQLDVGGMGPGGAFPEATDVLQEGVLVSPVRIVENGEWRHDILQMITGMSRLPTHMNLDFRGMLAANKVAIRRLQETIDQYGVDTVLSVMDESIDVSERAIRSRLRELPDGTYRAQTFLDHDGEANRLYRIHVAMTKEGDRLVLDFSESADQAPRYMNCTPSGLNAGVRAAILPILAHDLPWNEGVFRPIEIVARQGSIVSAKFPAPVSQGPLGAMWLVENTATTALSKLVATRESYIREAQASPNGGPDFWALFGHNQYGEHFHGHMLDLIYVGGGAYTHRDGLAPQGHRHIPRLRLQNVESNEQNGPILYLYRQFLPDSGGAGRRRGGASVGVGYVLHDVEKMHMRMGCHCYESPTSTGLFGGYPSACNRRRFIKGAGVDALIKAGKIPYDTSDLPGERPTFPAKVLRPIDITKDDVYESGPSAGAGWGDPIERPVEALRDDVIMGAVSIEMAREIYGVVITADHEIDEKATEASRAAIRAERLSWPAMKTVGSAPLKDAKGEVLALAGDTASIQRINGCAWFRCGCGCCIAPADENWKFYANQAPTTATQLGPRISLHAELEARRYACPSCARLLDVEIKLKSDGPLFDIELQS